MSPRPRLLIITPDFPPSPGGIQVVAHRLAVGMTGLQTRVIAPDCPGAAQLDRQSTLAVDRVRGDVRLRGARNALLNAMAVRVALSFRPELVLSAHIVTSPAASAIRRALGAATAQYFHAEEIGAKPRLAAFAARQADVSIAVSEYTASLVRATGAVPASLTVIPNGTDIPEDPAPQAVDRPTILTVARMQERYKGHDVLIRAFALVRAKVPDAQWIVIGDGSLRTGLEALARTYSVASSIRFLGAVSDEQRNAWLARANLLAMPSRLPAGGFAGEGFGIVYLEAGAFGKPVVAGNEGGAVDAVTDGENGLLVDPTDPVAVAEAISRLLADPELARRLGTAGKARAQSHAWPVIAARVQAVLLDLHRGSSRLAPVAAQAQDDPMQTAA